MESLPANAGAVAAELATVASTTLWASSAKPKGHDFCLMPWMWHAENSAVELILFLCSFKSYSIQEGSTIKFLGV